MTVSWKRWAPAIAVPVVIVAGALIVPAAANAAPDLPQKTPTEVLQLIAHANVSAFSGTVTLRNDLGLPAISSVPGGGSSASAGALQLLTGSHSLRVYRDGDKARLQDMEQLAERDVVVNGTSIWYYDSAQKTAVHATVPTHTGSRPEPATTPSPDAVATQLVTALAPTSTLEVSTAQRVAGRDAYTLVVAPKATDTLVGSVAIAVDAATGLPLSVSATARGESSPAWSLAFDSIDFQAPSSSLFDFQAPAGATVTERSAPEPSTAPTASDLPKPTVTGSGWDAVVSLKAGDLSALTSSKQFGQLTTAVVGGRLLHTSLLNVLVTDSGEVLAGSVPASTLEAAAAGR